VNNQTNGNKSNGQAQHDLLETTAQAIGSTLGSLAVKTGLAKSQAAAAEAEAPSAGAPMQQQPDHQHPNRKARRAGAKKKK
jgi:hypothetical protein